MMRWSLLFFLALPFGALQAAPEFNLMHPEFVVRDAKGALVN
jgi:hypothetical protein